MTATLDNRWAMAAMAAASAGALGLALISQYGFDLWPCELCYYQRAPYAGTLALGVLGLMPAVDGPSRRLIVAIAGGLFLLNAGIAGYHVGVEQRWWDGPSACKGQILDLTPADLLAAVSQPGRTGCEDAAFTFLGVSMAGYNALACMILAGACGWAWRRTSMWTTR
ncbi:MAG: disulfide bond formation protein B [Rhodospirillaceae bacterium]|nr:disulfide bond formation protein B [Rhodospirillaceae bacterium]